MNREVVFELSLTSSVHALTVVREVHPPLLGNELSFEMKQAEPGTTAFMIKRSPSNAPMSADPQLRLVRSATLYIMDDEELVARCQIVPETDNQGHFSYRFTIKDEYARYSRLVIAEQFQREPRLLETVQWLKPMPPSPLAVAPPERQLLSHSGGYVYSFRLINFIEPSRERRFPNAAE